MKGMLPSSSTFYKSPLLRMQLKLIFVLQPDFCSTSSTTSCATSCITSSASTSSTKTQFPLTSYNDSRYSTHPPSHSAAPGSARRHRCDFVYKSSNWVWGKERNHPREIHCQYGQWDRRRYPRTCNVLLAGSLPRCHLDTE